MKLNSITDLINFFEKHKNNRLAIINVYPDRATTGFRVGYEWDIKNYKTHNRYREGMQRIKKDFRVLSKSVFIIDTNIYAEYLVIKPK